MSVPSLSGAVKDEGGFTIVELMLAMSLGLLILGSATLITIGAGRHNNEVANRTDATQRGRLATERMVRLVRSQVCTNASSFPVISATPDTLSFYADFSDGSQPPEKHTLTYDEANLRLTDTAVKGSTATPVSFTATPTTEILATDVVRKESTGVFRYYRYPATAPATGVLEPNVEMVPPATGLVADDIGKIARVDFAFLTTGATRSTKKIRAEMNDQVFVRLADPNAVTADPSKPVSYNPSC